MKTLSFLAGLVLFLAPYLHAEDVFATEVYELAEPPAGIEDATTFLSEKGVAFPGGTSAIFVPTSQTVIARQTPANHKAIRAVLEPYLMSEEEIAEAKRRAEQGLGTPVEALEFEEVTLEEAVAQLNAKIIPTPGSKGPAVVLGEDLTKEAREWKFSMRTEETMDAGSVAAILADKANVICKMKGETAVFREARLEDALWIAVISVDFEDATAGEAVETVNGLIAKAMERFGLLSDLPFVVLSDAEKGDGEAAKITLSLQDGPASDVVAYVAQLSEHALTIKDGRAFLQPVENVEP